MKKNTDKPSQKVLKRGRRATLPEKRAGQTVLPTLEAEGKGDEGDEELEVSADIYRKVGEEVLHDRLEPAAWARALADCEGTRDEALTYYVRHRAEGLQREKKKQVSRGSKVEQRMVGNFQDFKALPIVYHQVEGESGPVNILDSLFWHTVAVVGMVGCLLAVGVLWPGLGFQLTWKMALTVVLAMQGIPVAAWWFGHRSDRSLSYARVTRMAAMIAMFASTGVGAILLVNPSNSAGLALYREEVIKQSQLVQFPGQMEAIAGETSEEAVTVAER